MGAEAFGEFVNNGLAGRYQRSVYLEVIDQSVSLWINNSLVHETRYQVPLKEIKGIQFAFAGTGFVDQMSLKDLGTGKVYAEDFSE